MSDRSHISKTTRRNFTKSFCTCYQWRWFCSPLTTINILYFRFCGRRRFHIIGHAQNQPHYVLCLVEFAGGCTAANSAILDCPVFFQNGGDVILNFRYKAISQKRYSLRHQIEQYVIRREITQGYAFGGSRWHCSHLGVECLTTENGTWIGIFKPNRQTCKRRVGYPQKWVAKQSAEGPTFSYMHGSRSEGTLP